MENIISQITSCIEQAIRIATDLGSSTSIVVYPVGEIGVQTANILKNIYQKEALLIDDGKCKYSDKIYSTSVFDSIDANKTVLILASTNQKIFLEIKEKAEKYIPKDQIILLDVMKKRMEKDPYSLFYTKIGKYSYGPLCRNHYLIKSIGAFCSFAEGTEVVGNHEMGFITTHPIISRGKQINGIEFSMDIDKGMPWYMSGVTPKYVVNKQERITIGNDVWLGRNVIVTNNSNIGNGVIAGAGAVITKDVPDYAVVAGVPAKTIKFRYSDDQIKALNSIAWWDWSDEDIRERFDDFYLPIEKFIEKYL